MFAFTDRSWLLRYVPNHSDRTEGNQRARSEGRAIAFWSLRAFALASLQNSDRLLVCSSWVIAPLQNQPSLYSKFIPKRTCYNAIPASPYEGINFRPWEGSVVFYQVRCSLCLLIQVRYVSLLFLGEL